MKKSILFFLAGMSICISFLNFGCNEQQTVSREDYDKLSLIIVEKDMEIDSLKQIINLFIEKEDSNQINK